MAQVRTASLTAQQAERIDQLATQLGGMSKAFQHVLDYFFSHAEETTQQAPTAQLSELSESKESLS